MECRPLHDNINHTPPMYCLLFAMRRDNAAHLTSARYTHQTGYCAKIQVFGQPGEFVATGLAGKYYVSANDFRGARPATRNEIRTDGTTDPICSKTYFSSSVSKEGATLIEVKPGEETAPIEIRMSRQQNLSISGVVSGIPAPVLK